MTATTLYTKDRTDPGCHNGTNVSQKPVDRREIFAREHALNAQVKLLIVYGYNSDGNSFVAVYWNQATYRAMANVSVTLLCEGREVQSGEIPVQNDYYAKRDGFTNGVRAVGRGEFVSAELAYNWGQKNTVKITPFGVGG